MAVRNIEMDCPACGKTTFLRREPVYDGFKKTGERLFCASCGHGFPSETEVSFREKRKLDFFTDDEKPRQAQIFNDDEKWRNCRYCRYYIVNPFTQRCAVHNREVQASDYCEKFEKKPEKPAMAEQGDDSKKKNKD